MAITSLPPVNKNLQPGDSGPDVVALQNWLIQQGFNIPAGATGFYGDQTKQAVSLLQQQYGVDTAGNSGLFGPRTIEKLQQVIQPQVSTGTSLQGSSPNLQGGATGTSIQQAAPVAQAPTTTTTSPSSMQNFGAAGSPENQILLWAAGNSGYGSDIDKLVKFLNIQGQTPQQQALAIANLYGDNPQSPSFVREYKISQNKPAATPDTMTDPATGKTWGKDTNGKYTILEGTTTPTGPTTSGGSGLSQSDLDILASMGLDPGTLSPSDAKLFSLIGSYYQKTFAQQGAVAQINESNFHEAMQQALKDPEIAGKYADLQAQDIYNFQQNLVNATQSSQLQNQLYQTQFKQDQKTADDSAAAAGQAYSGYREQAKQRLAQEEGGVVESSRRTLQQNLDQQTSDLQSKYGTNQFNQLGLPTSTSFFNPLTGQTESLTANMIPGTLQGSLPLQKESDVFSKAQTLYQTIPLPQP